MISRMRAFVGFVTLAVAMVASPAHAGYVFTTYDGPNPGNMLNTGTNLNGISNTGTVVGFTIANDGSLTNFTANPLVSPTATILNINNSTAAMAFGINSAGTVVGTDGNGNAISLSNGMVTTLLMMGQTSAVAFGINDNGAIVGQFTTAGGNTPGFVLNGSTVTSINAPTGVAGEVVNAQGINNNGFVVGFFVGTDGQDHGFQFNLSSAVGGVGTGTAIADPTIPTVPGEPGATFVFSQILGINDKGIAVGYYGDSTTSQHGFIYNTHTGVYTFLDDPSEAFNNGVEVTQITGITNSGEISGFYSDANGVFHGFVAKAPRG
jgi:probable HAF family extracellular repeat protein